MTLDALLPLLRCPACQAPLAWEPIAQRDPEAGTCGLLRCGCATYPVLDEVPILRDGHLAHRAISDDRVMVEGDDVSDVVRDVEDGRGLDALVRLLTTPWCPWPLNRIDAARRLSQRTPLRAAGLAVRRRRVRAMLARRDRLTAEDWLAAFYWHAPVAFDPFNYFFFRFGQPRFLNALALAATLPPARTPVLDVACGFGHLLHALTADGRPGIGLDQNAHQAWLARHYVAPGAAFVCGDADAPLPFADGAAGAALCTDAFHHFHDQPRALAEMRRAADGPVLLVTVGNADVPPPDGQERAPGGYAAMFQGTPWRVQAETDLVVRYLDRRAPDLTASSPPETVARSKYLSYVVARDEDEAADLFRDHGRLDTWPHLAGTEALNPLYEADAGALRLRAPSRWYAFENRPPAGYLPSALASDVSREALHACGARLGLPARYARPAGRPLTQRLNRSVEAALGRLRPGA